MEDFKTTQRRITAAWMLQDVFAADVGQEVTCPNCKSTFIKETEAQPACSMRCHEELYEWLGR